MESPLTSSALLVVALCAVCIGFGWWYFQRVEMKRPPIGVFNRTDVIFLFISIILIPLIYLILPISVVLVIVGLAAMSLIYFTVEPLIRTLAQRWLVVLLIVGANVASSAALGVTHPLSMAINDLGVILTAVGIANLWVQSGLKARDAALLGALLIVYDFIATSQLSTMGDIVNRLGTLPFAPLLTWGVGLNRPSIGLGDLLMATCFPLSMRKAFGQTAGIIALIVSFGAILLLFIFPPTQLFPVMVLLGPLMVIQYFIWIRQRGSERTMREYRAVTSQP